MPRPDVWIEVRTGALKHNLREVRSRTGAAEFCAVVKANAYGHELQLAAEAFVAAGADLLGVSRLEEALRLRASGIGAPILCMAPVARDEADEAVRHRIDVAADHPEQLAALSAAAVDLEIPARVHLKIDTGMGRLGVLPNQVGELMDAVQSLPRLDIVGAFTHFANATEKPRDLPLTRAQFQAFLRVKQEIQTRWTGKAIKFHCANSAAAIRFPETQLDLVRIGTLLYGQSPFGKTDLDLKDTWAMKARIVSVRELPAGSAIGYGSEHRCKRNCRIAVVAVGTSDGFALSPEGPLFRQSVARFAIRKWRRRVGLKVGGRLAPVLGRVSMNLTVIDVTDVPDVKLDDAVEVPCLRLSASGLLPRIAV